jgi:hypothetical protein
MVLLTSTKLRTHNSWQVGQPTDDIRRRALARLYARKSAVDELIGALERYQREQGQLMAKSVCRLTE